MSTKEVGWEPEDWPEPASVEINGLEFVCTCQACPEQYDVFKDGKQVAYVRLRWSHLRVDVPECGQTTIYSEEYNDGGTEVGYCGIFDDEGRRPQLTKIAERINKHYETTNS